MSDPSHQIRLASTPAFTVGSLHFEPATRQLMAGGQSMTLEPRVMQVIALLASANGHVVGRDEMIDRCWDGRVVGEHSINRVIAIIRKIGAANPGAFTLETIARVGYLLKSAGPVPADPPAAAPPAPSPPRRSVAMPFDARFTRRAALIAGVGGLTAVGAVGAVGWRTPEPVNPIALQAEAYIAQGRVELDQRVGGARQQAITYFRRATELAPDSAEAWGALAIGYSFAHSFSDVAAKQSIAWTRSAAQRALELDPDNADAVAAMILARTCFRRWAAYEAECHAFLAKTPGHPQVLNGLTASLANVGRWRDAIVVRERQLALYPDAFMPRFRLSLEYWQASRLPEAEASFTELTERWPSHAVAQSARLNFYALNGQFDDAQRVAETLRGDGRGEMVTTTDLALDVSRAIATEDAAFRRDVLARVRRVYADGGLSQGSAAGYLAELGAIDDVFDIVVDYFFAGAVPWRPAFNPQWPPVRHSNLLFTRQTTAIRTDPRFAAVTRALGLDEYWRASGKAPDYRLERRG